jgi:hypothetical protein
VVVPTPANQAGWVGLALAQIRVSGLDLALARVRVSGLDLALARVRVSGLDLALARVRVSVVCMLCLCSDVWE